MLVHPTLDQLHGLGLAGVAKAFADLIHDDEAAGLGNADWLALLLDREAVYRQDRRLGARLRHARLRHNAVPEDIDYRAGRGTDRALLKRLIEGAWIEARDNLVITGPTGVGKSWLACALGHKPCRDNRSVLYERVTMLFDELALAHGDGSFGRRLKRSLASADLLILDDWGLEPLNPQARHDLLEILEDRYARKSTLVTSQVPVADWHAIIGNVTYADARLDRRPQRPSPRPHRRLHAPRQITQTDLTGRQKNNQRKSTNRAPRDWRDQIGIPGGISSEQRGGIVGIRRKSPVKGQSRTSAIGLENGPENPARYGQNSILERQHRPSAMHNPVISRGILAHHTEVA